MVSYMEAGWAKKVKALLSGRGVDSIVETSRSGDEDRGAVAL